MASRIACRYAHLNDSVHPTVDREEKHANL